MESKWKQLYNTLREDIKQLHFDEKYLSERLIAQKYNINRLTVRRCISELIKDGYLYKIEKSGTYISKKRFFSGSLIHWNLDKYSSTVSDFKKIENVHLGECLKYTRRYFSKNEFGHVDKNLCGIEEIFVSTEILLSEWKSEYEQDISISLYNFIAKYNLASVYYNKKEVKTFTSNNKHYIMLKTDIYSENNKFIAISTIIQPFQDFSIKYLDYTNQSETIVRSNKK